MRVQSLRVKEWLAWLFLSVPGPAGEQNSSLASCNTCCVDSFVSHRIFSRDIALQFCCWEPETSDAFSGLTLTCGPHRSTYNCRHLRFYSDSQGLLRRTLCNRHNGPLGAANTPLLWLPNQQSLSDGFLLWPFPSVALSPYHWRYIVKLKEIWASSFRIRYLPTQRKIPQNRTSKYISASFTVPRTFLFMYIYAQRLLLLDRESVPQETSGNF